MPIKDKQKNREYQREWARKNGKTKRVNQRGPKNRQKLVDDAKSNPCVICNIQYPIPVMDLHHADNSEKTVSITGLVRTGPYADLQQEVDKCVPLCANCHRMVHAGLRELPDLVLLPSGSNLII